MWSLDDVIKDPGTGSDIIINSLLQRLVTIGNIQSEQSLVIVAQWEEYAPVDSTLDNKFRGYRDILYQN